jgi:hypothetical protein
MDLVKREKIRKFYEKLPPSVFLGFLATDAAE